MNDMHVIAELKEAVIKGKPDKALEILEGESLAKALHSYVDRITTRGEYGVLATINTKAVYDWRRMRKGIADLHRRAEGVNVRTVRAIVQLLQVA